MSKITENIDAFIEDLLHINDVDNNKLMDLYAGDLTKTYIISHPTRANLSKYVLGIIRNKIGKIGSTVLLKSSLVKESEQVLGENVSAVSWRDANGNSNADVLHNYVATIYKEMDLKGNNPLFLSIGGIKWKVAYKKDMVKEVVSPFLIFPIKLIRPASPTTPIHIEFINDEIFINPCFLASLRKIAGDKIVDEFPHPNGKVLDVDLPVDLNLLDDGEAYFEKVYTYVNSQSRGDLSNETVFEFNKDLICFSQYNHDELCMYFDIKRNKEKIYKHPLINRIFAKGEPYQEVDYTKVNPQFILPRDSVQERITRRVLAGQSLVVKGPPGTGKTVTITNLIASLLNQNKKILLSSQKTAAMCEVYAKLPEEIRKFVMLLDSETEAQATKLSVVEVKKEFNKLLQEKRSFAFSNEEYNNYDHGNQQVAGAISNLLSYQKLMFDDKDVCGLNYYTALDNVCKYDVDPVLFADPKDAYNLTVEQATMLADMVEDAGSWFDKVANEHIFIKSPWYPFKASLEGVDSERVVLKNKEIAIAIQKFISDCDGILADIVKDYKKIPLEVLELILSDLVSDKNIENALKSENGEILDTLSLDYQTFIKTPNPSMDLPYPSIQAVDKLLDSLRKTKLNANMTKSEFFTYYDNFKTIELIKNGERLKILNNALNSISELHEKSDKLLDEFYSIFSSDISQENLNEIEKAYESFESYVDKDLTAPKLLDFKAKKIYGQLKTLGYGAEIPFNQFVKGVSLYHEVQLLKSTEVDIKIKISSHFKLKLTDNQINVLYSFASLSESLGVDVGTLITEFERSKDTIFEAFRECTLDKDYTLLDLLRIYDKSRALARLKNIVEMASKVTGIERLDTPEEEYARQLYSAREIVCCKVLGCSADEIVDVCSQIYKRGYKLKDQLREILRLFDEFGQSCFENFYTTKGNKCKIGDLEIYVKEGQDRNLFNAVNEYLRIIKSSGKAFSLERFFRPFELGKIQRGKYSFVDILQLSINWLAVEYKKYCMGANRNGLGDKISNSFEDFKKGTAEVDEATLSIIERNCLSRINQDDKDFDFLKAERASGETLRRFFKQHAKAILKLKKCFILSPSTASVFFSKEDFSDFDIVIIDEASQIEPTSILPVLFRAKQVVLVGDEWQMPPIKHFSSRADKAIIDEEGEIRVLGQNTSVLGLALENCAFPVEQLVCHYRSKTEPLITFSQERFYPSMRTFPATLPKAEGLGFKDVFVDNGCCDKGVNEQEAIEVVKQLKEHFDRYYDPEKRTLNGHSVGIVAFGKEQKDKIEKLAFKDVDLAQKINDAIANFDDIPEKLIFFKTIETVQGQEAEHLIISITYGRNKSGQVSQTFGQLNRGYNEDKLGQCIFNVAVTRAKSSVTVVHSILASEIELETVSFIRDYLYIVEKFNQGGKMQWQGKSIDEVNGFIKQVAEFIESNGISRERILIDCGATKGSVKIPIVILSKDMSKAELGIWCEKPLNPNDNYFDYNIRYFESLVARGWNLHRLFIHEWVDNNVAEKEALTNVINKYVKK